MASLKMRQIQSKISALESEYQELFTQRHYDIAKILIHMDFAEVDDKTLVGGFLHLKHLLSNHDPQTEGWCDAGGRFLRRHKIKKRPKDSAPQTSAPIH